ncbi:MAG TPA: methylmalonyl Co-A mutase-associated GTPase MeaB [Geminicoccaceae bacterium]
MRRTEPGTTPVIDPAQLAQRVRAGDRRALARAITLVESVRPDHGALRDDLLDRLMPAGGQALRVGITGTPGAGKSTFIETFGQHVIRDGERIAVLAVDPSSRLSGGSILGDKTRMQRLSQSGAAFIRPSPAGTTPGGVARRTREASYVCEAAGFGVILIETVGVGQSEVAVADMVDCFILLLAPGAGDELQGIKRGIVELADLVVINKADADLRPAAEAAATAYRQALMLLAPRPGGWTPEVLLCSAREDRGVDAVLDAIRRQRQALEVSGELARRREGQRLAWFDAELEQGLVEILRRDPALRAALEASRRAVALGRASPAAAARRIFQGFELHRRPATGEEP